MSVRQNQCFYRLTVAVLALSLCAAFSTPSIAANQWMEEDDPEAKISKTGLQMTEGTYGIPVTIDNIFQQIQPNPPDDQECTNGSELSEMDMCLTQPQLGLFGAISRVRPGKRKKRQASANGFSLWENGVIPYVFNTTFAAQDRDAIVSSMSEWEKGSCVRFRPANREDRDLIVFRDGKRCSTNIGRITGEQAVTLAKSCRSKRILIHELGHVIGLIHEHQRHDRDKHVKVMLENVRNMSQERYQFTKLLSGSITDKAVKYDYTSVMHYGKNYFARSPHLITLHTIDQRYQDVIGRAEKPSFYDLETVNRLYLCSAGCPRSLHCGDHCYMDKMCMCRCRAGYDKAYFSGPGPYRNNLPDSTCEFFATRGECTGNIKDTVRPLCAKSCGLHRYKFDTQGPAQSDMLSNGNLVQQQQQQQQQQLRQQLQQQQQQSSKLGGIGGSSSSGSLLSPTSPSASMVWSGVNSVNTVGNNMNFNNNNNNNNFINSIYSNNNLNSVNDIQYLRGGGGGGGGIPRQQQQQQQQRAFQQQALLREGGQFLPGPDGRGQQARRALSAQQQQQQRFRAAFLQRQAALSSSEPNLFRSLVLGRSSNGRTARLLLPAQVNSRSLQRRLSNAPSPISTSRRLNFLRQQDSTRIPLLARSGATLENLLGPAVQGARSRNRLTRTPAFSGVSSWVGSGRVAQQREIDRNRQRLMSSAGEGQRRVSNTILGAQNLARLSPTASSAAGGAGRWRDVSAANRRFSLGAAQERGANDFPGGIPQWRKSAGSRFRGQNMPVTLDVERVSGPLPLAGFNGPEFGAGGSARTAGKDASGNIAVGTDAVNIGGSDVVIRPPERRHGGLDVSAPNNVANDQSLSPASTAETANKEPWENQPPPASGAFNMQDISVQQLHSSGDPSYMGYEVSAVNGNSKVQGFASHGPAAPPPVPPVPPLGTLESTLADPALWDGFLGAAASSSASVAGPPETAYSGGDTVNSNNNNVVNGEPYIDVLSLSGQPPAPIIDHVGVSGQPQRPQGMAQSSSTNNNNPNNNNNNNLSGTNNNNQVQYDLWSQLQQGQQSQQQQQQQQAQFKTLPSQQQQQQHQQSLFQRLNQFQAFSDPEAMPGKPMELSNSALYAQGESNPNTSATEALALLPHGDSHYDQPTASFTETIGPAMPLVATSQNGGTPLQHGRRRVRFPTRSQRLFSMSPALHRPEASMANQQLGLSDAFFTASGGSSSHNNNNNNNNSNNNKNDNRDRNVQPSNSNSYSQDLFQSLLDFGRRSRSRRLFSGLKGRTGQSVLFSLPTA